MKLKRIKADSVSDALAKGLNLMLDPSIVREDSRNGGVSVWDGPVVTHTRHPLRRVLFSAKRNANPFFHLFESLWMLGGRNDLPWVAQFNKQMKAYSDDGGATQPAAYGHRWRGYFGYDQLAEVIAELKRSPGTRRAVLGMWDPWGIHTVDKGEGPVHHFGDLQGVANGSSDVPCNTECYFTIRDGKLYMSIQCRSNDLLWGAHGANAVHFSILLEYVAARVGVEVGEMFQYSWNYHLYDGVLKHPIKEVVADLRETDRYAVGRGWAATTPLFTPDTMGSFATDLPKLLQMASPQPGPEFHRITHKFLAGTAVPMLEAWRAYKAGDYPLAFDRCADIAGEDWSIACSEWIQRRHAKLFKEDKA